MLNIIIINDSHNTLSLSLDLSSTFAIFVAFCLILQGWYTDDMNIITWTRRAADTLANALIPSSLLDAELILAETLRKPRTYLHAHPEEEIDPRRVDIADARLSLRLDRVPLAYILGYKEFYGRKFFVSPAVLVPRPESEDMISLFLEMTPETLAHKVLIDVGTGSGCLGITAALERPDLRVILSDISKDALSVARKNCDALATQATIQCQSLLRGQIEPVDYIFANLPYVDKNWEVSPELRHEPSMALFAENEGLKLIKELLMQAPKHLTANGLLFIEADPVQHDTIIAAAEENRLQLVNKRGYILVLQLIST